MTHWYETVYRTTLTNRNSISIYISSSSISSSNSSSSSRSSINIGKTYKKQQKQNKPAEPALKSGGEAVRREKRRLCMMSVAYKKRSDTVCIRTVELKWSKRSVKRKTINWRSKKGSTRLFEFFRLVCKYIKRIKIGEKPPMMTYHKSC